MTATPLVRAIIGLVRESEVSSIPGPARLLARGLTKRCPRCGGGGLFRGWIHMVAECPTCSYYFEREEGFFLGALVVNIMIVEAVIIAVIVIGFATTLPDPPLALLAAVGSTLAIVVPFLSYPSTKTTWTAIDMIMRKTMGETYATTQQPGTAQLGTERSAPQHG